MSQSNFVECPICGGSFSVATVNEHVEKCLAASEHVPENNRSPNDFQELSNSSSSTFEKMMGTRTKTVCSENSSSNAMKRTSSNLMGKWTTNPPLKRMKSDVLTNGTSQDKGNQNSAFFSPGRKEPVTRPNSSSSFSIRNSSGNTQAKPKGSQFMPLAERMRPKSLSEYVGQSKVLGSNSLLRTLLENEEIPSMILWGPPGCGKTSLAHIIANNAKKSNKTRFVQLSATTSGINDVKEVVKVAKNEQQLFKRKTILFVDEIHRFNKLQQDTFLPHVENGTITLIGATTENPSFQLNNALLSRCRVMVLEKLTVDHVEQILKNALTSMGVVVFRGDSLEKEKQGVLFEDSKVLVAVEEDAVKTLANLCDGDARIALNGLQLAIQSQVASSKRETKQSDGTNKNCNVKDSQFSSDKNGDVTGSCDDKEIGCSEQDTVIISVSHVKEGLQRTHLLYDRNGEEHYNIISALHKSIRGNDENAALYWLARMLVGGEDPLYVARRLVRCASEDIGLADPQALKLAVSAYQACHFIGMPECDVILAQAAVYLARAPKSVEVYNAYNEAKKFVNEWAGPQPPVPLHIRNAPTKLMKQLGYGAGYKYNPAFDGPVEQTYLPPEMQDVDFFTSTKNKATQF